MKNLKICVLKKGIYYYKTGYGWSEKLTNKSFFTPKAARWHKSYLQDDKIEIIQYDLTNPRIL